VENIRLDITGISADSAPANIPGQGNSPTTNRSNNPFFSKVLAREQTPKKAPEETTSENGDSEQAPVADGNSLPEEDSDLPQKTVKKDEIIPVSAENELIAPELPGEQTIVETTDQPPQPDVIVMTEPSSTMPNTIVDENVVETAEDRVQPENNSLPIALATENQETEPPLKVESISGVDTTNLETEEVTPESEAARSDVAAETVVTLNPQQADNVKPFVDPESKTSKITQKPVSIDKLSLVDSKADAMNILDTDNLPEAADSDLPFIEPVKPEAPVQSPIARALMKEFSDIQSNGSQQNTFGNETGIKLGDIQTSILRAPAQPANNILTSPLPSMNIDRPGWEQSFVNNVSWMNNENVQTANIRISPADLGPIEIKMTLKQDQMTLNINAHHALTRETLENSMPRLKEVLADNGFNSVNVDVSGQQTHGGGAEKNAASDSNWFGSDEGSEYESEQYGDGLTQAEQRLRVSGSGMVDIFA